MVVHKKHYTYADYVRVQELPENADKILELIDGEIIQKMPSFTPSQIASIISFFLMLYLREHPLGRVTGEGGGYRLDDENVFNPDVGYISFQRMPDLPEREAPLPPDFAVEVKSPTDRKRAMRRKAEKYLDSGTRLVWLGFPEEQEVEVYLKDEDVKNVGMDGVLDGTDILPGFTLAVREIFAASSD